MAKPKPTDARTALRAYYAASDRLRAQLNALSEGAAPVRVTIAAPEGDIEALAFLVMMQASKAASEDLRSIMAEVKAVAGAKSRVRKLLGQRRDKAASLDAESAVQLAATLVAAGLHRELTDLLGDGLSELGEMEQLRLQMVMDRISKMMSTLSNILKKLADTQSAIAQNLR